MTQGTGTWNAAPMRERCGMVNTRGPSRLWLVRHALSRGNEADAHATDAGKARVELDNRDPDVELSETGRRQAAALGRWIGVLPHDERPTVVLSSPYVRAAATAEIAYAEAGINVEMVFDERLRERDLGVLDGMTGSGIRAERPEEAGRRDLLGKFYYRPPAGESWADVALRVRNLLTTVEMRYAGERLLVVSHQAVLLVCRYVIEGLSERVVLDIDRRDQIANCSLTSYESDAEGILRLTGYNDVDHLTEADEDVTEEPDVNAG